MIIGIFEEYLGQFLNNDRWEHLIILLSVAVAVAVAVTVVVVVVVVLVPVVIVPNGQVGGRAEFN